MHKRILVCFLCPTVYIMQYFVFHSVLWPCWFGDRRTFSPGTGATYFQRFCSGTNGEIKLRGNWLIQFHLKNSC